MPTPAKRRPASMVWAEVAEAHRKLPRTRGRHAIRKDFLRPSLSARLLPVMDPAVAPRRAEDTTCNRDREGICRWPRQQTWPTPHRGQGGVTALLVDSVMNWPPMLSSTAGGNLQKESMQPQVHMASSGTQQHQRHHLQHI